MNNDAVQRLREPGAWVLLGSAALMFLGGLIELFSESGAPFTLRAFNLVRGDQFFTGVAIVGIVVIAVLLAARWGGGPTPQARNIALAGVVVLAVIAVVMVVCVLAGLAAGGGQDGIVLKVGLGEKVAMFVYGIAKLAILGVGGYYVFTVYQSFGPVRASAAPFPPGYAQQQPAYGGYAQPQYGQQGQRGPEGSPAYPQYGQQPPQAAPESSPSQPYAAPGYSPQAYPGHYQQPPPAQPYQSAHSQPQQSGQAQPSEGEWAAAYGSGEQRDIPAGGAEGPSDPYRPPQ